MANHKYLPQALLICQNALKSAHLLTPRQRRTFRRFIKAYRLNQPITHKQIRKILRRSKQLQISLTQKVGGPV